MTNPAEVPVLVTGASRGIGAAIASAFAELGHPVAGTATSKAGAASIRTRLAGLGDGYVMDVADADSVAAAVAAVTEAAGPPLVVVNNAGITRDDLMLRMKPDAWDAVVDTNLSGPFRVIKACVRAMVKARYGRIINIGSVVARMGNPGQANYIAAKAGVEGLTRALALELASRNVTVNAIAPGFIESDMTAALTEAQRDAIGAMIPQGRIGSPEDVAAACTFLASDSASYITGQTLGVNGGLHLN